MIKCAAIYIYDWLFNTPPPKFTYGSYPPSPKKTANIYIMLVYGHHNCVRIYEGLRALCYKKLICFVRKMLAILHIYEEFTRKSQLYVLPFVISSPLNPRDIKYGLVPDHIKCVKTHQADFWQFYENLLFCTPPNHEHQTCCSNKDGQMFFRAASCV